MAMLQISLFGELQLTYDGQNVMTINTPRLQSLLAYLLLHRQAPQRREEIGYLFWPDSPEAQARTNLRNLIHLLRRALPDADRFIHATTLTLQWRSDAPYTLDVEQFEHILDGAMRAKRQGNTMGMRGSLEQAIGLYRGDLLTGCYDEWIMSERERMHQRLLNALTELIDVLEQERAYSEAIEYLQHLIRIDPLREVAYQRLMQIHLLLGDRASAIRVYYSAATTIERELGVEPSQPLRDTYARLLRGHEAGASDTISGLHAGATVPLVGRRREWMQLLAAWRHVRQKGSQLVILWGEAGIGKTRLAEELFSWVQRLGYTAVTTRCYAAEGDLSYAPVATWLRSDALRRTWSQLPHVWLQEVSRVVPEISGEHTRSAHLQPLREPWQRKRLFEGLAHAVTLTHEQQLLIIDDLHWCDQDSLEWLHYLMRFKHDTALLIVATARREDLQMQHPLQLLLAAMRQQDLVTEIELPPLDQAETADLATHLITGPIDPAHLSQLYRQCEGNPLFIVELARIIGQERERVIPDAIIPLPPRVHAVLSARLSQLLPLAHELAGLAATVGRDFTFALLQQASNYDEAEVVRGLDELWQRRIIREQEGSATAYAFSHDKLREVAYGELSLSRRQFWHRRIAASLEAAHVNQLDIVAGQIALHCELGGLWEQAIVHYERAASIARAIYANSEAISMLRRALTLLETNTSSAADQQGHRATAVRLHTQLGEILLLTGSFEAARDAFSEAIAGTPPHAIVQEARLQFALGETWQGQLRYAQALQCYDLAQATLERETGIRGEDWWHTYIANQINRVWAYYFLGYFQELRELIAHLEPLVTHYGTPAQQAIFVGCIAASRIAQERLVPSSETVGYLRRALELHETSGSSLQDTATIRFGLGYALLWRGEFDGAERHIHQALQEAQRLGDSLLHVRCTTFLAVLARRRGQLDAVQQQSEDVLRMAEHGRFQHFVAIAHANLAWCSWRCGRLSEAESHGRVAMELWGPLQQAPYQWLALWPLIAVLMQGNQIAEALRFAGMLLQPTQQPLPSDIELLLSTARQAWEQGQQEMARVHLEQALTLAQSLAFL